MPSELLFFLIVLSPAVSFLMFLFVCDSCVSKKSKKVAIGFLSVSLLVFMSTTFMLIGYNIAEAKVEQEIFCSILELDDGTQYIVYSSPKEERLKVLNINEEFGRVFDIKNEAIMVKIISDGPYNGVYDTGGAKDKFYPVQCLMTLRDRRLTKPPVIEIPMLPENVA